MEFVQATVEEHREHVVELALAWAAARVAVQASEGGRKEREHLKLAKLRLAGACLGLYRAERAAGKREVDYELELAPRATWRDLGVSIGGAKNINDSALRGTTPLSGEGSPAPLVSISNDSELRRVARQGGEHSASQEPPPHGQKVSIPSRKGSTTSSPRVSSSAARKLRGSPAGFRPGTENG